MKTISVFYYGHHLKLALADYHETLGKTVDFSALHQFIGRKVDGRVISAPEHLDAVYKEGIKPRHAGYADIFPVKQVCADVLKFNGYRNGRIKSFAS